MKQLMSIFAVAGLTLVCTACPDGTKKATTPVVVPNPTPNDPNAAADPNKADPFENKVEAANDDDAAAKVAQEDPDLATTPPAPVPGEVALTLEQAAKVWASFQKTSAALYKSGSAQCGAAGEEGSAGTSTWYPSSKLGTHGSYELIACTYDGVVLSGEFKAKRYVYGSTGLNGNLDVTGGDLKGQCEVALTAKVTKPWSGKFCGYSIADLAQVQPAPTPEQTEPAQP